METASSSRAQGVQQNGYRGRVRSGCLTCRSRKVKCDELRPVCNNCTRLKRRCFYKARKGEQRPTAGLGVSTTTLNKPAHLFGAGQSRETASISQTYPSPLSEQQSCVVSEALGLEDDANIPWGSAKDPFLSPDSSIVDVTARLEKALRRQNATSNGIEDTEFDTASTSDLISRDIELTTTMDLLAAREAPLQPSFSFFLQAVDSPSITPYDGLNWRRMKLHVAELGASNAAVSSAIVAVAALYTAQLYGLPQSKAVSLYHTSKHAYQKLINDRTQNFDAILAATFLLCLFEVVHYDTAAILKEPNEVFINRLEAWAQSEQSHSPFSSRLVAWIRLLHTTTIRGGSIGIISDTVISLLSKRNREIPNLKSPLDQHVDTPTHLYEMLSTPIFEFYFQLQMISGEIAKLTHYHRSRTTGTDQEEVAQKIAHIKARLQSLWESRSATERQKAEDLRTHLGPKVANPIITLIGLCTAAYHAEFVEMGRVLGDPVTEFTDSKQAMRRIREIIDGDWNAFDGDKLNSGYLRPLFLYAIECMDREENEWATERLRQIKDPINRSDFFASFGKALSDAQLRKERRVTSKYFCLRYFGVSPPFM